MEKVLALISASIFCTVGAAQAAEKAPVSKQAICISLEAAMASDEKEISAQTNNEMLEDSAPRAMVEEAKIAAAYQAIQANLMLMEQHRCQPYAYAITSSSYLGAALQCKSDSLKTSIRSAADVPTSCDRSKWTRSN